MSVTHPRSADYVAGYIEKARAEAASDPVAAFAAKMAKHYANDVPRGFGWYAEDLVLDGHRQRWFQLLIADLDDETAGSVDDIDVVVTWLTKVQYRLTSLAGSRPGSTSWASNAAEDLERVALDGIVHDAQYTVGINVRS